MKDHLGTLVPYPRSVQAKPGTLELAAPPRVTAGGGTAQEAAAAVRRVLAAIPWPRSAAIEHTAEHTAEDTADDLADDAAEVRVHFDPQIASEAFRLSIDQAGVTIAAGGAEGAFYAAQTIRQLLPDDAWRAAPIARGSTAPWQLPAAEIEDEPALSWRGAHIDVARHFFTKRELLALIDALAAIRINRLHLHLTDDQGWRVESRAFPALHEVGSHRQRTRLSPNREQPPVYEDVPYGGYYTLDDLAEITAFARDRMMTLVPEVDLPGHCAALLAALPQLASGTEPAGGYQVSPDWGILPFLVSPLPDARAAVTEILAEIVTATDAPYVHIGGDECKLDGWRNDARITAYQHERGLTSAEELHAAFLRDLADKLADDFGARAIVWDEGFTSTVGRQGPGLRPDTIVMAWRGLPIARAAAQAGHDVILTPVLPTYFDYYQASDDIEPLAIGGPIRIEDVAGFAPVPADWPADARARVLGTQFQSWTEYIRDGRALEYMIFPRACALADVAWAGTPSAWQHAGPAGQPPLRDRVAAHLGRLAAAGLEYRPLSGPLPSQQGGTGPRRHRDGYLVQDVATHLDQLAAGEQA
jgi:hexosaminidase